MKLLTFWKMCTKRFAIAVSIIAALISSSIATGANRFDKNKFLEACHFSIKDNILSDKDEYNEVYSSRWTRDDQTDSLYKLFYRTHDYDLGLKFCHSLERAYNLWANKDPDIRIVNNIFARTIKATNDRDEVIRLILLYARINSPAIQKSIGETCLDEQYHVNDSLKYKALNCAINGQTDINAVLNLSNERMAIAERTFGADSGEYSSSLYWHAILGLYIGQYDAVDSLFRHIIEHDNIYIVSNINNDPLYARYQYCMADGEWDYAAEILDFLSKEALKDYENTSYVIDTDIETKLVLMYENAVLSFLRRDPEYKTWIEKAVRLSRRYIYPEDKRMLDCLEPNYALYDNIIELMNFAYNTPSAKDAYNTALFVKGASWSVASNLIQSIRSRNDRELLEYVDSLRQNYRGHPLDDIEAGGISRLAYIFDPEFSEWSSRKTYYEEKLQTHINNSSIKETWNITSDDIYKALRPGESAVEIVRVTPFGSGDDFYQALIINYGNPNPIRKNLCKHETLVKLFHDGHFYDNSSNALYKQVIEPMMSEVTGKTVYIAPTGLFSTINMASVSDGDGNNVSDRWEIKTCISTKAACDREPQSKAFQSIALFGGMEYEKGDRRSHFSRDNEVNRDIEREGYGYLPASLGEVEKIDDIAGRHDIRSLLHTGADGTEAAVRALSGKETSIIHLATHGFYYNKTEAEIDGYTNRIKHADNALNRCGIILSNGQSAWLNGIDQYDRSNGILLGSEIANLDLSGTDLVVLSACNTGLGDISNEGISGLQQAFKRAGVKTLLLSLKPINDNATMLFMVEFYEHLFNGESLQASFNAARDRLKSHPKYSSPDYWAAYILLS